MIRATPLQCALSLLLLAASSLAVAQFDEDYETKTWQEIEFQLPKPPQDADLRGFYVSALADNRFYVDRQSVSIGADGVVRYTLVVLSSGGARSVSYEGVRCASAERRLYAFGRRNGDWSKARTNDWVPIKHAQTNRQHAALYFDYFCPDGVQVRSLDEALKMLDRGGPPVVEGWRR